MNDKGSSSVKDQNWPNHLAQIEKELLTFNSCNIRENKAQNKVDFGKKVFPIL
jgi:hypothetical protein